LTFQFDTFRWPVAMTPVVEFALAAGLAIQGVRLLWVLVTPAGALGMNVPAILPPAKADFIILERFDPFFRGLDGPAIAASGSFTLFGVRTAANGRGAAILAGPDGVQKSHGVGENIAPGLMLLSVGPDHAVLARGNTRMRVAFQKPAASTLSLPATAPAMRVADAEGGAIDYKAFLSQTAFQPRMQGNEILGYAVAPRDSGQALLQAGLQPGDVIRTINGSALSRNRFAEIEAEFAGASQVVLTIERGGQIITKNLRVTQ